MSMTKQNYQHDCSKCVFLGDYISDGVTYDLYVCSHKDMKIDTLIGRFSSDGPDYYSGVCFRDTIDVIAEAYKRAKDLGYALKEMDMQISFGQ